MPYLNIERMDDSSNSKSKPLHSTNILINNIDNEINDPHPTIPKTNTINFEHYDLWSDFVINQIMDQTKNENFKNWKFHKIIIFHDDKKIMNIIVYLDNLMKRKD